MRWVNLTDRQPKTESVRFRYAPTGRIIPVGYICRDGKTFIEEIRDTCNGTDDYEYSLQEIEWLDEEEEIVDKPCSPDFVKSYSQEEVDLLLKEQHRNTVFDAVESVKSFIRSEGRYDIRELQTKIANLKIRKP